jgi:hypothetical protein
MGGDGRDGGTEGGREGRREVSFRPLSRVGMGWRSGRPATRLKTLLNIRPAGRRQGDSVELDSAVLDEADALLRRRGGAAPCRDAAARLCRAATARDDATDALGRGAAVAAGHVRERVAAFAAAPRPVVVGGAHRGGCVYCMLIDALIDALQPAAADATPPPGTSAPTAADGLTRALRAALALLDPPAPAAGGGAEAQVDSVARARRRRGWGGGGSSAGPSLCERVCLPRPSCRAPAPAAG